MCSGLVTTAASAVQKISNRFSSVSSWSVDKVPSVLPLPKVFRSLTLISGQDDRGVISAQGCWMICGPQCRGLGASYTEHSTIFLPAFPLALQGEGLCYPSPSRTPSLPCHFLPQTLKFSISRHHLALRLWLSFSSLFPLCIGLGEKTHLLEPESKLMYRGNA